MFKVIRTDGLTGRLSLTGEIIVEPLARLFSSDGFMPHGYCYLWDPGLVWLHAISDLLIFLAYTSIPITLVYFVRRRRDLPFNWMFICFGVFIVACGLTHGMEVWNLWHASYWVAGGIKGLTALASVSTAIFLVRLMPDALTLPSPQIWQQEIMAREHAGEKLRVANETLAKQARLLDLAHDAILVRDVNTLGKITFWNDGAVKTYGWSKGEAIGKSLFDLLKTEFPIGFDELERNLFEAGSWEGELVHTRRDGRRITVASRHVLERDQSGRPIAILEINRDMTERLHAERALRELSSQLLRVQDEERRRIGRDLHDTVCQNLAMLKLRLDSAAYSLQPDDSLRKKLEETARLAEETLQDIRTTSYELYPPMLEEAGLKSAIPWFLDGFMERSGIKTSFDIAANFPRLSRDVELAVFRVLQEALANVRRHSGSLTANVRVHAENGIVTLEVSDQGKGVPPEIMDAYRHESFGKIGIGLRGMKERLRQLGGQLEVNSAGGGTTVTATLPAGRKS